MVHTTRGRTCCFAARTTVNFSEHARREAQTLLDAVAEEVAKATRTGLDALRAEVDVRATALERGGRAALGSVTA